MADEIQDLSNKTVIFKGFSSRAERQNFKMCLICLMCLILLFALLSNSIRA